MRRSRLRFTAALLVFVSAFVLAFSFAAAIRNGNILSSSSAAQKSQFDPNVLSRTALDWLTAPTFKYRLLTSTIGSTFGSWALEEPAPLSNSTRTEIYDFIEANPGVQFRGICDGLGLSVGLAQFHLRVLKKAGLISFIRDGRYKRYFKSNRFSEKEMEVISLLRCETTRNILKTLLSNGGTSHGRLASQLGITSQGLTWHMKRLKEAGVVRGSKDGMKVIYSLEESRIPRLASAISLVEP
jgi:DNA-binding transcriptional ArsR family regulator